jgi:long-chain acyl-CoA synthetase
MNLVSVIDLHPAEADAIISAGEITSYGALRQQVHAISAGLIAAGVKPGDRVALLLASNWYFVVAHLGALGAGAIVVPLNPQSPTAELQRQLDVVQATAVVVGPSAANAFTDIDRVAAGISVVFTPEGVTVGGGTNVSRPFEDLLVTPGLPAWVERSDDDVAVLMFTSGTAGSPRAAMLTHGNLRSNIEQMQRSTGTVSSSDTLLCVLPLSHIYGLNATLHLGLLAGARTLLVQRFDPTSSLQSIADHHVTIVAGVPPMYEAWASLPEAAADSFVNVRVLASGASKLEPLVAAQFAARFNKWIGEGYGLTEASPTVTAASFPNPRQSTIGLPMQGVQIRVVDESGNDVVVGDPGELWVAGPNVFVGYWNDAEATARALDSDGWLHTGDIAVVSADGSLSLVDRAKDLIIVSGFNVFPAEVEEALLQHPGIQQAAVIGVSHPHTGESVKAFVVAKPDRMLDEDEVIDFCATQLAKYKCPSKVVMVSELPRMASGKIIRRELT